MENTEFTVIAELTALHGFEEELLALVKKQVAASRREKDVIYYAANEAIGEKGKFIFYEVYGSEEAFEINKASEHTQAFFKAINGKLKGQGVTAAFMKPITVNP